MTNNEKPAEKEAVVWDGEWVGDKYRIVPRGEDGGLRIVYPEGAEHTPHTSRMVLEKALESTHARAVAAEEKYDRLGDLKMNSDMDRVEWQQRAVAAEEKLAKKSDECLSLYEYRSKTSLALHAILALAETYPKTCIDPGETLRRIAKIAKEETK